MRSTDLPLSESKCHEEPPMPQPEGPAANKTLYKNDHSLWLLPADVLLIVKPGTVVR